MIRFTFGNCWLGTLLVAVDSRGICAVSIGASGEELAEALLLQFAPEPIERDDIALSSTLRRVVAAVDQGQVAVDLPLAPRGTPHQQRVWSELRRIPPGTTVSYQALADRLGGSNGARAVAAACGANPIAVLIPCHRVVGSDGALRGYRWGLERKRALLEREAGPRLGLFDSGTGDSVSERARGPATLSPVLPQSIEAPGPGPRGRDIEPEKRIDEGGGASI